MPKIAIPRQPPLEERISQALHQVSRRHALLDAVARGRDARASTIRGIPHGSEFRDRVAHAKQTCVANLPELIARFTDNARARGATVYFAKDGQQACDYVLQLARQKNARLLTKSKSLTTEEIELNQPLQQAGLEVLETDLGELIVQMAGELPYHLVFPAVHKTADQVAELFRQKTGEPVSAELSDIMALMRRYLRPKFLTADIGITGANVAIAETGTLLIETNEGNGRLVSGIPPVHVAVLGVEKIVADLEQAMDMILAHPVSATGQLLTTYVSMFGGRAPLNEDAGRELHIILLDNGRMRMRSDDRYREALSCIRCGACMNICPTYGVVGGHVFGHIYPGPIGIPWTAQVHGLENAAQFADLCISCGLCQEICPADIDIPMMIAQVKQEMYGQRQQPLVNKVVMASETFAKFACALAPVSNWLLQSKPVRWLNEKLLGLDSRRALPHFYRRTLKKRLRNRRPMVASRERIASAALFADFTNYTAPGLAMQAIALLEQAGVSVVLPEQKTSGYPYISYGELDKARQSAEFNVARLAAYVERGHDLVAIEPTAVYSLRHLYPALLRDSHESQQVAAHTYGLFEYVARLMERGALLFPPQVTEARSFGFHVPCHQRGSGSAESTLRVLRALGYDVEVVETGTCCGMGGTFGMKHGALGYDLSMAVGQSLFELFEASGVEGIVTESSVCALQLNDGARLPVHHPLALVNQVLNRDKQ